MYMSGFLMYINFTYVHYGPMGSGALRSGGDHQPCRALYQPARWAGAAEQGSTLGS